MIIDHFVGKRRHAFEEIKPYFHGKKCLEIGGPSFIFQTESILPIYGEVESIDNCNFSRKTVWNGDKGEGLTFPYARNKLGLQILCEATHLKSIENESYDCVISSHVLEHIADPLRALLEWKRVLKNEGLLLLVVSHKQGSFDHNRPVTNLSHLIQDLENEVDEHDLSHLPEILKLHDLSMDPNAGAFEDFARRCKENFNYRCLHHHVFTTETVIRIVDLLGLKILLITTYPQSDIIILCRKSACVSKNRELEIHDSDHRLLHKDASWRRGSYFSLDKKPLVERFWDGSASLRHTANERFASFLKEK